MGNYLQDEVCKDDEDKDWDYIYSMMDSKSMGYRIEWLTKVKFLLNVVLRKTIEIPEIRILTFVYSLIVNVIN